MIVEVIEMNDSTTTLYNVEEFEEKLIRDTLNDVYLALEERGYARFYGCYRCAWCGILSLYTAWQPREREKI